jgi:hypothetical protein
LPVDSLLRKYLESIAEASQPKWPAKTVADEFLCDVREALEAEGCRVWLEYELAGVMIDVIAEKSGKTLGVDLVGCAGDYGAAIDLERYRILRRAGFSLFPLPYRCWLRDRTTCLSALCERLESGPENPSS